MNKSLTQLKAELKAELSELREKKYSMVVEFQFWQLVEGAEPNNMQKKLLAQWKVEKEAIEMRYKILAGQA